jgi:hypothetical protein
MVATVAISLGLGIGVNTTVFNLFNITVLAKPTAVEPDRLAIIEPGNGNRISYPNYKDLNYKNVAASPAFAGMAVTTLGTVNLRDQNRVENVLALETSANYFQLLGARAYLGRTFSSGDDQSAVLGYTFWQKRFQGDPGVLGRSFYWNGHPLTVGGIMSRDYRPGTGAVAPDVYLPLSAALSPIILDRRQRHFSLLARKPPETGSNPDGRNAAAFACLRGCRPAAHRVDNAPRVAEAAIALLELGEDPPEWVGADYKAALMSKFQTPERTAHYVKARATAVRSYKRSHPSSQRPHS